MYFPLTGGSIGNMYAMNLARFRHCPDIKEKGIFGCQRLVVFTSEQVGINELNSNQVDAK